MYILLVNPIVSAKFLSMSFAEVKLPTIALFTIGQNLLDDYRRPAKELFDIQVFMQNATTDEIIEKLKDYKISYVIHGTEKTLDLSEKLAHYYTPLLANNPYTSSLRYNKLAASQQLKANGYPVIQQHLYDLSDVSLDEVKARFSFPCFFRPLWGNSSKYAQKICSEQDILKVLELVKSDGFNNSLLRSGDEPVQFILSDYIDGEEFSIDTFSYKGKHFISSVVQIHKKTIKNIPFYRYSRVVKDQSIIDLLTQFIHNCLDALEFSNGFAHTEVFIKNKIVYLIEVNPRVSGGHGIVNKIARLAGLPTQVDLFLKCHYQIYYDTSKENIEVGVVDVFNFSTKPLSDLNLLKNSFSSIKEIYYFKEIGFKHAQMPMSLSDEVALVICASSNKNVLLREIEMIVQLDECGRLSIN